MLTGLLAALLLAQGEGSRPASAPAGKTPGDTLVVACANDAVSALLSVCYTDAVAGTVVELLGPSLMDQDFVAGALRFRPGLATSWEWGDGGKTLTYALRGDVTWGDGRPVTAEDVVFTWSLLRDPEVGSPRSSYAQMLDPEGGVVAVSPREVRFRFTRPYDPSLQLFHTGVTPVPKHLLEGTKRAEIRRSPLAKRPEGHGPFSFASREEGRRIVLRRNPVVRTHVAPFLDRIVLEVHRDYAQRLALLEKGDVDLVESVQFRDLPRVRAAGLQLLPRGKRFLEFIAWNLADPLFAERRVRRALTLAIDRDGIIRASLTDGQGSVFGRPAVSTFTPELAALGDAGVEPLPFDPRRARAELEAAGWEARGGDGVLVREGRRFEFPILVSAGNQQRAEVLVLIQDQLRRVGVSVHIEPLDFATLNDRITRRQYQAALLGFMAPLIPDPRDLWRSGERQRLNVTGYANAAADELMDRGIAERDPAVAARTWQQLARLVYEDQPCTFLYWFEQVGAVHARFRGVVPSPLSVLHGVEEWWVPRGEQKRR